jgi:hypothetical protein
MQNETENGRGVGGDAERKKKKQIGSGGGWNSVAGERAGSEEAEVRKETCRIDPHTAFAFTRARPRRRPCR